MDYSKIAGWLILIAGITIIGWTLVTSYNIFTGEATLPEFFEITESEIEELTPELQAVITGVIPVDSITNLFNLIVWSMLAFILIFGGSQISILGIKLIKK